MSGRSLALSFLPLLILPQGAMARAAQHGQPVHDVVPPFFTSAGDLVSVCSNATGPRLTSCIDYVQGVIDGIAEGSASSAQKVDFCLPAAIKPDDVLTGVLSIWKPDETPPPGLTNYPAASMIHLYLEKIHPCSPKAGDKR